MNIYRIAKKKWIDDLSGIGAKVTGGRWNRKGIPLLYCASSSSLAILEKLVNIDFDLLPDDLYIAEIEVTEKSILKLEIKDLPKNWDHYPSPDILKEIGEDWIRKNEYFILQVPSAVNPDESNFLINVSSELMNELNIKRIFPFKIDNRFRNK